MTARADWSAYTKANQWSRYDRGLCRACPRKRSPKFLHCLPCRKKNAARERARNAA